MKLSNLNKIVIHSVPRSGSTWLGSIFDSNPNVVFRFQPLFSYGHKGQLSEQSKISEIENFFDDILETEDDFVLQKKTKKEGVIPIFKKHTASTIVYKEVRYHHILKNLLEQDKNLIVIGLIRNPLSVINSWLKAPKEFRKDLGWDEIEEWRFAKKKNMDRIEEFNGFEKWKEVTLLFTELEKLYPNRFYLLRYDNLLVNPKKEVEKLFMFCGLNYTEQTNNFIVSSSNIDHTDEAYSVFRINQDDEKWRLQLNTTIIKEIQKCLIETELEKYLQIDEG